MSGRIGDENFSEAVLVRPRLLRSILSQGYAALWSDSDMVWLKNPLPLLPQLDDAEGVSLEVSSLLVLCQIINMVSAICFRPLRQPR